MSVDIEIHHAKLYLGCVKGKSAFECAQNAHI